LVIIEKMLTTAWVNGVKTFIDDYKKSEGIEAFCSMGHKLSAKCGSVRVHHFAHYPNTDPCDIWRGKMTYWHAQWQKIVLDKSHLEVCLDANGKILGHSAFAGQSTFSNIVATKLDGHIADIINPSSNPNSRPLVVEIQHSSMSKEVIDAREAYYQHMVWLFDFTPRLTTIDKCNKIAFVDGAVKYLKEKVTYIAMLSCATYHAPVAPQYPVASDQKISSLHSGLIIPASSFDQTETRHQLFGISSSSLAGSNGNNNNLPQPSSTPITLASLVNSVSLSKPCRGDECFNDSLTATTGFFMVISTRTKHWFDTTKPTYFDTGFCILRLLLPLNGNFVLTLYLSYEEFITERMPPINQEKVAKSEWFKTINPAILIKLGMIPKIIDVQGIHICRNRVIVSHKQCVMADLGFSQGMNDAWHAGSFYVNQVQSTTIVPSSIGVNNRNTTGQSNNANDDLLFRMISQAKSGVTVSATSNNVAGEILIVAKLRRFLGLSSTTQVEIVNKKGGEHIVVYCSKETYDMKDKFKSLEMKYKKGNIDVRTGTKKISGKQSIKQTRNAIASSLNNPGSSSRMITPEKLKKDNKEAFAGEVRPHFYAKVSVIESKLANL
jgi:hypothetical protein